MTRAKEIMKEAEKVASANTQSIGDWSAHFLGFVHGAEWADEHPHWISVEDEFPPRENEFHVSLDVLATDGEMIIKSFYDYDHECWVCFEGRWCFATVTHWMPMPAPPHHIIDANKKVDRVIGTADHIKTALDVLNKKGGEE